MPPLGTLICPIVVGRDREVAAIRATCKSDATHCGSCNVACSEGQLCVEGDCVTRRGTCRAGENTCASGRAACCNGSCDCYCYRTTEGATRCGQLPRDAVTVCGNCTSSLHCEDFGPSAICAKSSTRSASCCNGSGDGFCAVPCPT